MIPKDSLCAQKLSAKESTSPMNITTEIHATMGEGEEEKINNTEPECEFYENISSYSTKEGVTNSKLCASPPLKMSNSRRLVKPRSMSDGTLRNKQEVQTSRNESSSLKPGNSQSKDDSRTDILKTILNMLPSDFANKRQNSVHPAAPNTSSEDSGISVDNSTAPHLQKIELECPTEDESENSGDTMRKMGSSVLSLKGLFGSSSSQSSPSTNKESRPSPKEESETRPQSLTSSSSSVGYDNLAFVPVDILSRRSSLFSDASC